MSEFYFLRISVILAISLYAAVVSHWYINTLLIWWLPYYFKRSWALFLPQLIKWFHVWRRKWKLINHLQLIGLVIDKAERSAVMRIYQIIYTHVWKYPINWGIYWHTYKALQSLIYIHMYVICWSTTTIGSSP